MCIKSDLKLTLKMAHCSVVYDLSFDMLDIATSWINHSETIMDRKTMYRYKNDCFIIILPVYKYMYLPYKINFSVSIPQMTSLRCSLSLCSFQKHCFITFHYMKKCSCQM